MESNDIKKERHRSIGSIGSYIQIDKLANKIKEKLDDTARDQLPDKYKNITKKQKIGLLFLHKQQQLLSLYISVTKVTNLKSMQSS